MAKFEIRMVVGGKKMVRAKKFAMEIQGEEFFFLFHKSPSHNCMKVSEFVSGKGVVDVPTMVIIQAGNDEIAAAKGEIQKLVDRVGAARVRSVLAAAL